MTCPSERLPRSERLALARLRALGPGWHRAAAVACGVHGSLWSLHARGLVERTEDIERVGPQGQDTAIWRWRVAP